MTRIDSHLGVGSLDSRYLKLDGSNDPITGNITINVNSTTAFFVEQDGVKDNVLVVDTTNGYVGIGTTPSFPLHVVGSTFNSVDRYNSNSANLSLSPSIRLRGAMGTVSTPTKTLLGSWIGKNDFAG